MNSILTSKWTKVVVFVAVPRAAAALLVWRGFQNDLTADPIQFITHTTGDWMLRFLVITLAITPLRKILHLPQLIRFRRMLGLFAFFYVCLHFTTWIWLDQAISTGRRCGRRVRSGRSSPWASRHFVLLIPLAITSTAGWIRRLGGKRWQMLHRLIYVTAVLGVIHYYWLVKSDVRKPLEYAFFVGVLLAWRLGAWLNGRGKSPPKSAPTAKYRSTLRLRVPRLELARVLQSISPHLRLANPLRSDNPSSTAHGASICQGKIDSWQKSSPSRLAKRNPAKSFFSDWYKGFPALRTTFKEL